MTAILGQRNRALGRQMRLIAAGATRREGPRLREHAIGIAGVCDHLVVRRVRLRKHSALVHLFHPGPLSVCFRRVPVLLDRRPVTRFPERDAGRT